MVMMMSEITKRYYDEAYKEAYEEEKRNCAIRILNNAIPKGYTIEQIAGFCGFSLSYLMEVIESI